MPNTKIINVLKGDTFQDVFDAFTATEATEVIFIFPKGSKFAKNARYFQELSNEGASSGKQVSVMTTDPIVADFASQYGINVLSEQKQKSTKPKTKKVTAPKIRVVSQTSVDDEDEEELPGNLSPLEEPIEDNEEQDDEKEYDLDQEEDSIAPANPRPAIRYPARPDIETELASFYAEQEAIATPVAQKSIQDIRQQKGSRLNLSITQNQQKPEDIFVNVEQRSDPATDISQMWAGRSTESPKPPAKVIAQKSQRPFFIRAPFLLLVLAALTGLVIFYTLVGSTTITLTPHQKDLNLELALAASGDVTSLNADSNRIPGQKFSTTQEITTSSPVSGRKDVAQKARGYITIYNTGATAQKLVATTRFESKSGLIYRIQNSIDVPGRTPEKPGSIRAIIYADRAGDEYNIEPTEFTIPGFKDTPRFSQFSAKSTERMTGGIIGNASVVTRGDYDKAVAEAKQQLKEKMIASIKSQAGDLVVIDQTPIAFGEPKANADVDEATEKLEISLSATAETIAFRESDVKEIIEKYVQKTNQLIPIRELLKIEYKNTTLSNDQRTLTFQIAITGKAATPIDIAEISKDIIGTSKQSIQEYFKNNKGVATARILVSPFWLQKIPKNPDRLKIDIKL